MKSLNIAVGLVLFAGLVIGSYRLIGAPRASAQSEETGALPSGFAAMTPDNSERMLKEGQKTFRFDTFGDEAWWGDTLHLHEAIEGAKLGGVGPGISPATALFLGLKVDVDALPPSLVQQLQEGQSRPERSRRDTGSIRAELRGRRDRAFQVRWQLEISRNSVCLVSFHSR